ncbi:hypothetical protein ICJ04_10615 [Stenotrophomonas sp. 169]|uniref:hypothetical protein n=1 Tax=Stenotrophomonas sp. 169 TaxID=2770322 RepID=UPI0016624185|nr:hypothetical protein [Stenotrophomonas sp. 169]QNR96016.1 hypothetical protein ICJ04_10615 [Stenotrophomonas sp. 169]
MNQQNTMAGKTAADLVQAIATKLYGEAGAGITDLVALINLVAAEPVRQVSEAATLRSAAGVLYMWEDDPDLTGYMGDFKDACTILELLAQHAPPAQTVELAPVRAALQAAEALCVCCASVDGYSRNELHAFGVNIRSQFRDALALIDRKAVSDG